MSSFKEILKILKCQQCLSALSLIDKGLSCNKCKIFYPISKDLIFMGYNKNYHDEIQKIIEYEKNHQTNLSDMQHHYDYAPLSFKTGLIAIDILKDLANLKDPIAIDIGSGGAPFAKILSEKGFNTFRLELDPNSLYSGLFWHHSNLCIGKHIVADASILPFSNKSVDIVFCKDFIHHIENFDAIFKEINRVLKKDGIFLMIEPTKKFKALRTKAEVDSINSFGHNIKTIFEYYSALKNCGFKIQRFYLFYSEKSRRLKLLNYIKKYFNKQFYSKSETNIFFIFYRMFIQRIIKGENILYMKKQKSLTLKEKRPGVKVVEPRVLTLNDKYITDQRILKFNEILDKIYDEFSSKNYDY